MRDYKNVTGLAFDFEEGLENASGIQEQAYLIPLSYLKTEAVPVTEGTTPESLITITGNHVLQTGKAPILCTPMFEKSGSEFDQVGEVGSALFEAPTTFFIPQISAKTIGGAVALKNFRGIVLFRRPGETTGFWQIGTKGMPAKNQKISGGFGTGTGEVGVKMLVKSTDVTPYYKYDGELPTAGV